MMYQCQRCGLTRASSQEPMGLVIPQCKCPWEFVPPTPRQRTWVGLTGGEIDECFAITPDQYLSWQIYQRIEKRLKEKNT